MTTDTMARLDTLPMETLLEIFERIGEGAKCGSIRATCRHLLQVTENLFWRHLKLELPQSQPVNDRLFGVALSPFSGIRLTQRLTVINLPEDSPEDRAMRKVANSNHAHTRAHGDIEYHAGNNRAVVFNRLIRMIISRLPTDVLQTLNWQHSVPIEAGTLHQIMTNHQQSLKDIDISRLVGSPLAAPGPLLISVTLPHLVRLACRSVPCFESDPFRDIRPYIAVGKSTIKELEIGAEQSLFLWENRRLAHSGHSSAVHNSFLTHFTLDYFLDGRPLSQRLPQTSPPADQLKLTKLTLFGQNVSDLGDLRSGCSLRLDWGQLRSLTLLDCLYTARFLQRLGSEFLRLGALNIEVQLKHFSIRYNAIGVGAPGTFDKLQRFLGSFSGLESLSIMVDEDYHTFPSRSETSLTAHGHGSTLRQLVYEIRSDAYRRDGVLSKRQPELLAGLSQWCTDLRELSVSVEGVGDPHHYLRQLHRLTELRTLQLQTGLGGNHMPNSIKLRSADGVLRPKVLIGARNLLKACFAPIRAKPFGPKPKLELLVLGSYTTADKARDGSTRRNMEHLFYMQHVKPITFLVDWKLGKRGWRAIIVEKQGNPFTMEKLLTNDMVVLKCIWNV